ncbi:hypothetical protein [Olivibacter oleidegradans]|uniref:Uncharacterized protein n=1 Tax=Olivibacter oleidegradans TaxID=760123 RepID=A0ABV6HP95_9SPHI
MKQNLRLMGGVCPDEPSEISCQSSVKTISRKNKVVSAARMASLMMSDELLMINTSCTFFRKRYQNFWLQPAKQASMPIEINTSLKNFYVSYIDYLAYAIRNFGGQFFPV